MFAKNGMLAVGLMAGLVVMGPNFLAGHDHDKGDHKDKKNQHHSKSCDAGDAGASASNGQAAGSPISQALVGGSNVANMGNCNDKVSVLSVD